MLHAFGQLAVMAGVTLGVINVPHPLYYDNPRLVFAFGL